MTVWAGYFSTRAERRTSMSDCVESDDFGLTYHRFTMEDYRKLL